MKQKSFFRNLMFLLCMCFVLTVAVFAVPKEVKAGGDGLRVDVRLISTEEWEEIFADNGDRATIDMSTGDRHIVKAEPDWQGECRYECLWFNLDALPPVNTVFALSQVELPTGYMLDFCPLPMKRVFTQDIYDRLMQSKASGDQALEEIVFDVYVRRIGTKVSLEDVSFTTYNSSWTGKPQKPHCELSYRGTPLVENRDYTVTCSNNTNIGTATAVFKGKGDFTGTRKIQFRITPVYLYEGTEGVSVSKISDQKYTGKAIRPSVTVKANGKTLKAGTDYTLEYMNNVNVGKAFVKIIGKGHYSGERLVFFNITGKSKPNLPPNGAVIGVGNAKYKMTKSAVSGGTVTFMAPNSTKNKSFTVPSSIKLGSSTFKVTAIDANAFKNNKYLTSVTIGKYVKTIGSQAFYGDSKLKTIKITGNYLSGVGKNALKGIYSKGTIKVPASKYTTYKKLLYGKGQAKTVKITK